MACPLACVPKDPLCISTNICSASLASTHQSNTMSWFLLYRIFPLRKKPVANFHNILLSLSEASCGYSLSSIYHLISKYQGLPSFSSSIKQQCAGLPRHLNSMYGKSPCGLNWNMDTSVARALAIWFSSLGTWWKDMSSKNSINFLM